jgi:N-acylneuraminate cytidylyltransferase
LEPWLHDAGQWYWYKVDSLTKSTESIIRKYILKSELEVQDIDNMDDWILAELKYKMRDPNITDTEYGKLY